MANSGAVFEPKDIKAILKQGLEGKEKKEFEAKWAANVEKRAAAWKKKTENQANLKEQLEWEAEVVEYVDFLHKQTSVNGNSAVKVPPSLKPGIPLLGPRFFPPSYFHIAKRNTSPKIQPETSYLIPITIVHPIYYPKILAQCPQCDSREVLWDGWTATGAREVHGVRQEERALGYQLRCKACKAKYGKGGAESESPKGYCFATTSRVFWEKWEHWKIPRSVPYFLSRSAVTHELFDLLIEIRPSSTSLGLATHIKQLHLLEYWQEMDDYLTALDASIDHGHQNSFFSKRPELCAISSYNDVLKYNGNSISSDLITDLYREFGSKTRQGESTDYCKTRKARSISTDNTFKSANKAVVLDKERNRIKMMKGGTNSIINEESETLSWRFCQSASPAETGEMLAGIVKRCEILGIPVPESAVVDNCCAVRNKLNEAIPGIKVNLDVYHFMIRYLAVVINGTKNIYRSEVAKDIRDAIISSPATKDRPATYWSQSNQEERIEAAYKKWADNGKVWTSAATKVHLDQFNHVKKGCLSRHRQDIRMDGSRIEGSHKGWNSLQRAQPSGLEMYSVLAHDFVLRRNIRIAEARNSSASTSYSDAFVLLTGGSHHVRLVSSVAASFNDLVRKTKANLQPLPLLPKVNSGEEFGLVSSHHNDTFGGLFTIKEEDEDTAAIFEEIDQRTDELDGHEDFQASSSICVTAEDLSLNSRLGPSTASTSKRKITPALEDDSETFMPLAKRTRPSAVASVSDAEMIPVISDENSPEPLLRIQSVSRSASVEAPSPFPVNSAENPAASFFRQAKPLTPTSVTPTSHLHPPGHQHPTKFDLTPTEALTRSQKLFFASTHTNPLSQTIKAKDEFFLFMDMRAEAQWASHTMNTRKWVDATHAYNKRLSAQRKSHGDTAVLKTPRALMDKLSDIEGNIQVRISKNNFKSNTGSETFWKKHCDAVPLFIKDEANENGQLLSKRKSPGCLRCKTLLYPGPTGHPGNHKKGYCADGVAQKEKQPPAEDCDRPPMWPQPAEVFRAGTHFHAMNFLRTMRELYDKVTDQSLQQGDYSLEDEAFSEMFQRRTKVVELENGTGQILFRLYEHLQTEGCPDPSMIIEFEGAKHLRVDSLT